MRKGILGVVLLVLTTRVTFGQSSSQVPDLLPVPSGTNIEEARKLPPLPGAPATSTPTTSTSDSPVTVVRPTALQSLPLESPTVMPSIPSAPTMRDAPAVQSLSTPAITGLPNLPPVPGVPQAPPMVYTPHAPGQTTPIPTWTGSGNQTPGTSTAINQPVGTTDLSPATSGSSTPGTVPFWDPNYRPVIATQPMTEGVTTTGAVGRVLGPQMWGHAEYLIWFMRSGSSPALVQLVEATSGQTTFDSRNAVTLFPVDGSLNFNPLTGVRGTIGAWFDPAQTVGFEASYSYFGDQGETNRFVSGSNYLLGHPFTNATNDQSSLYSVSNLTGTTGIIEVHSGFHMQGGDGNFLFRPARMGNAFQGVVGFRYLDVQEWLSVRSRSSNSTTEITRYDWFETRNQFFGGQFGIRYDYQGDIWLFNVTAKLAFGAINETVVIDGMTNLSNRSGTTARLGGVYALNSNIGTYTRTRATYIPEVTVNTGWRLAPWASAFIGYNFMLIGEIVRPGRQIDTTINPDLLPFSGSSGSTSPRPSFSSKGETFWLQGINVGLTLQY